MKTVSEYRAIKTHHAFVKAAIVDLTAPDADICEVLARAFHSIKTRFMPDQHYRPLVLKLIKGIKRIKGFRFLGEGAFSVAFVAPDGMVYKVNSGKRRIPDAWLAFAVSAMEANSPLFPIIEKIVCINQTFCAKMELLHTTGSTPFPYHVSADRLNYYIKCQMPKSFAEETGCELVEASLVIETICKVKATIDAKFDLHHENLMYRKVDDEYVPVIIDPLAAWHTYDTSEFTSKLESLPKQEPRKLVRPKQARPNLDRQMMVVDEFFNDRLRRFDGVIDHINLDANWFMPAGLARKVKIEKERPQGLIGGYQLNYGVKAKPPKVRKPIPFWVNPKGKGWVDRIA
jgi:hypothetical protein